MTRAADRVQPSRRRRRETAREAIGGYGTALELVDLAPEPSSADDIVAANVFHRAVVIGSTHHTWPPEGAEASLTSGGRVRARAACTADLAEIVCDVATLLGAVGERLLAGDRLITGSVVQVPIAPGEDLAADLGDLGRVAITISR